MSIFFGHWDEDAEVDEEELDEIKQGLIDDSSLFGMHWRDFDEDAMQIYESRHRGES